LVPAQAVLWQTQVADDQVNAYAELQGIERSQRDTGPWQGHAATAPWTDRNCPTQLWRLVADAGLCARGAARGGMRR